MVSKLRIIWKQTVFAGKRHHMNMGYELYLRSIRTDSLCYAAEHMPPVPSVLRGKRNKRELQPLAGVPTPKNQ